MFDKLLRKLRKLEKGVRMPIQIPLDENGEMDRQCPSAECRAEFKVVFDDWRDKVRDEVVYCPFCRHEAPATEWNTEAQQEYIERAAMAHIKKVVNRAMREDARRFNARQPKGGLISISMHVKPSGSTVLIPPSAAEQMRQRFICEACQCRYSSVGAAFFCPACGHNSAQTTFAAAVESIRTLISHLPRIKKTVEAGAGSDAAADSARQILENALVKLVASFERFAEASFQKLPNASGFTRRRNVFQNLSESTKLWKVATGKGYEDFLSVTELAELNVYFQQRHLLTHREGIVDQQYIDRASDATYSIGQRVVIKERAVLHLAELIEKLANGIRTLSPDGGNTIP